jgi:hypothetical protein
MVLVGTAHPTDTKDFFRNKSGLLCGMKKPQTNIEFNTDEHVSVLICAVLWLKLMLSLTQIKWFGVFQPVKSRRQRSILLTSLGQDSLSDHLVSNQLGKLHRGGIAHAEWLAMSARFHQRCDQKLGC